MDRRQYLATVGILLGAGCASNESSPEPESSNEPSDPESTDGPPDSRSPSERTQSLPHIPGWQYDLPGELDSSAVTVDDGVYVVESGTLTHLSPTGTVQWTTDLNWGSSEVAEPNDIVAAGDAVYYTARVSVGTGRLGAHDVTTGNQLWARDFDISPLHVIEMTEGTVFAGRTSAEEPGRAPILGVDAMTGDERWRAVTGMESGATSSHGLLVVYSDVTNTVTSFDTATGEVQWEDSPGPDSSVKVFTRGDTLCVAVGFSVIGYSLPNGEPLWNQSLTREWWFAERAPPDSPHSSDIYVADGGGELRAIDTTTGDQRWMIGDTTGEFAALAVSSDSLVVAFSDGALVNYDLDDGSQRWETASTTHHEDHHVVFADETVLLISQQFNQETSVQAFNTDSGKRRWRTGVSTGDTPPGTRHVLDGHLILVTADRIYGLPLAEFLP